MIVRFRSLLRLSAIAGIAALASGCTFLTTGTPTPGPVAPTALTASDVAIVENAVGKRLSGQALVFDRMVPGALYYSTRYPYIASFTVCGQASTATEVSYFIGYLSRERGTFEIAGLAASGPDQKTIVGLCIQKGADSTALALRTAN